MLFATLNSNSLFVLSWFDADMWVFLCSCTDHQSSLKNGYDIGVDSLYPPAPDADILKDKFPYWLVVGKTDPEYDPDCDPE